MFSSIFSIMQSACEYQNTVEPKIKEIFNSLSPVSEKYFSDNNITNKTDKLTIKILGGFIVCKTYITLPEEEFSEMPIHQFSERTLTSREIDEGIIITSRSLASVLNKGGLDGEYAYLCGYAMAIGNSLYEIAEKCPELKGKQ